MISKLSLGNFKAIGETQEIPIKPITLLFGPNSAGKSSVLHGLMLVRGAIASRGYNCGQFGLDDDVIDLGGYPQYVFRRDPANIVEWSVVLEVSKLSRLVNELDSEVNIILKRALPFYDGVSKIKIGIDVGTIKEEIAFFELAAVCVLKYRIEFDGETALTFSHRSTKAMRLDALNYEHPAIKRMIATVIEAFSSTGEVSSSDEESIRKFLAEFVPRLEATSLASSSVFPTSVVVEGHGSAPEDTPQFFAISREGRREDIERALSFWLPRALSDILYSIDYAMTSLLRSIHYIGPLRQLPSRHIALSERIANLNFIDAPNSVWDIVLRDSGTRMRINAWLDSSFHSTRYAIELRHLVQIEEAEGAIQDILRNAPVSITELSQEEAEQAIADAQREAEEEARAEVESEIESEFENTLEQLRSELQEEYDSLSSLSLGEADPEDLARLEEIKTELEAVEQGELPPELEIDVDSEIEERLAAVTGGVDDYINPEDPTWHVRGEIADVEQTGQAIIQGVLYSDVEKLPELLLIDKRTNTPVTFRDVGTGISQIVPVLAHAFRQRDSLIAIEQPEIHIHPELQAELGDVFIQSALAVC